MKPKALMAKLLLAAATALALGAPHAASAVDCITDVMLIGETNRSAVTTLQNNYKRQGWTVIDKDLNAGAGGDYIYLLYKSAESANASNGFITGFYIKTGKDGITDTLTHEDRLYRLVPYDGGDHFKGLQGDLNSHADGATIHLYCTKAAFPDNRAVTNVTFNSTKTGAVGADGGTTGYDLNKDCGEGTDYIYMHVSTAAVPYVSPVSVTDVVARQRWPWNGLVDIACTVSGIEWEPDGHEFAVAAVMQDSIVHNATNFWVVKDGKKSAVRNVETNGNYRLLWDAGADLGPELHSNVVVRVTVVKGHARVQLWEGGPYWATTNVGAEMPEDYGLYFWWGDTTGYRREGESWVASNGSGSGFLFDKGNAGTYGKTIATLQSEKWITADGVLAPEHDAAHVHWGGAWRMPTKQELGDLVNKCNWTWTKQNGVDGYVVRGKGAYESASIFLPCVGRGYGTSLYYAGSLGDYWSSVPYSVNSYAWSLDFDSSDHYTDYAGRYFGQSVRPVQGFTE